MIRAQAEAGPQRPAVNPLRGEFAVPLGGELVRFDTRLATAAAMEAACGDRPIVEVLNGVVAGRRVRDVVPLLEAALGAIYPPHPAPASLAARTTVGEAEAFVLALIVALGFTVGGRSGEGTGGAVPLDGPKAGSTGSASPSAP